MRFYGYVDRDGLGRGDSGEAGIYEVTLGVVTCYPADSSLLGGFRPW